MANQQLLLHGVPGQVSSRPPASQERPGPAVSVPSRQIYVQKYPKTDHWSWSVVLPPIHWRPTHNIHAAPLGTARVINTLLRVVHGGSQVGVAFQWDNPQRGLLTSMMIRNPTETKDPKRRRIVFAGGDVAHTRVSRDIFLNPHTVQEEQERTPRNEDCKDEWVWEGWSHTDEGAQTQEEECLFPKKLIFLPCRLKRFVMIGKHIRYFNRAGEQSMIHGD